MALLSSTYFDWLQYLAIRAEIIQTPNGDILGFTSDKTDIYLGIPYGKIPARWSPAILPKPWVMILLTPLHLDLCATNLVRLKQCHNLYQKVKIACF